MRVFVALLLLGLCAPAIAWGPPINMVCANDCAGGYVTDRWNPVCADDGRGHGLGTIYPNPCVWDNCVEARGKWTYVLPVHKANACKKVWKHPNPDPFRSPHCACLLNEPAPQTCHNGKDGCERCRTPHKCGKCFWGWRTNGNGCEKCNSKGCLRCPERANKCNICTKGYHLVAHRCVRW